MSGDDSKKLDKKELETTLLEIKRRFDFLNQSIKNINSGNAEIALELEGLKCEIQKLELIIKNY
jgi:hypothetical protein